MSSVRQSEERKHDWSLSWLKVWLAAKVIRIVLSGNNPTCDQIMVKYPDMTASSLFIPSRERGRKIKMSIYTPKDVGSKPPVHLNLHGSGFSAFVSSDLLREYASYSLFLSDTFDWSGHSFRPPVGNDAGLCRH